jgi:hypothetical protein
MAEIEPVTATAASYEPLPIAEFIAEKETTSPIIALPLPVAYELIIAPAQELEGWRLIVVLLWYVK